MRHASLVLAALGAAASAAPAQFQTQGTVTYTLSRITCAPGPTWQTPILNAGGQEGIVNPGYGALFRITIGMSVPPGAATTLHGGTLGGPLTWAPTILPGSSGSGTNVGFWGGDLNIIGDNEASSAAGTWSDASTNYALAVRRRLVVANAGGGIGSVNANGSGLTDVQPAQLATDADAINHSNNFVTFQALWIPGDYTPRFVNFRVLLGSLGLPTLVAAADSNYINGFTTPVQLSCQSIYAGQQSVRIIPGPGGAALLVAAVGIGASCRRRVRETQP